MPFETLWLVNKNTWPDRLTTLLSGTMRKNSSGEGVIFSKVKLSFCNNCHRSIVLLSIFRQRFLIMRNVTA